jgi:hypothetical protein
VPAASADGLYLAPGCNDGVRAHVDIDLRLSMFVNDKKVGGRIAKTVPARYSRNI